MKKRYTVIIVVAVCILMLGVAGIWNYNQRIKYSKEYIKLEIQNKSSQNATDTYSFPGEFEKQQAIWMEWPSEVYNEDNRPVAPVTIKIITALAPYVRVNVITRNNDEIQQINSMLRANGYTGANISFYNINHLSIWARDVGPIFVKDSRNKLHVVDFGFNNYSRDGNQTYIETESQVDRLTAQVLNLPVTTSSLISEGGAIESNGRGTLMLVEAVALTRNPGMTKQQIEDEYKRVLGVKKIIWLKKGLAEDDKITSGHINEFARFADPNTILLAQVLPDDRYASSYSNESYMRLEENYNILKNSTDQDGKPFRIVRIPMPPTLYQEASQAGVTPPVRSYLNYVVTNGAVLIQSYWKPGRPDTLKNTENQVVQTFQSVFPGRKIIGIDAENINKWGGGIHCVTQHMPA